MAKKKGSADELADLYPSPKVIAVKVRQGPDSPAWDDAEVTVCEMDIIQIAQVVRALAPIRESISPTSSFVFLAAEHPDEICAALGVAIRWPAGRVGMLGGASFARVAAAVWECNADFFGQVLDLLASGSRAIPTPTNGAGETPLPTSAATAMSPNQGASH